MDLEKKMFVWLLILGSVFSTPIDEFKEFVNHGIGDISQKGVMSNIVPSRTITADIKTRFSYPIDDEWESIVKANEGNKYFQIFSDHIERGTTSRHQTFCIYDDNMREAALALFRIFSFTNGEMFERVRNWVKKYINPEMYMYALRLETVYTEKTNETTLLPPFIWNPHYFVNGESLAKASIKYNDIMSNPIDLTGNIKELVTINTNYSGWNLQKNGSEDLLNYFREDIAINSYYLGIHLLHPFWMSMEELGRRNSRFAENYYYVHQQLMARYNLEKLHITLKNPSYSFDDWSYVPYLMYKNGLPFPKRSCKLGNWTEEEAYVKTVETAIRECISRGHIVMEDGETVSLTNDSHTNVFAKLIRANFDGIRFAKIARSIVGYGSNTHPINEYNPAPSMLHHPETSLKDPAYWSMIQSMLNYYTDYKNTLKPFDMSQYESDEFVIFHSDVNNLTTYFHYYRFSVNQAMSNYIINENNWFAFLMVRQRRLKHMDFSFNFKVESKVNKSTIVRLYIGPECKNNCWDQFNDYFELDTFKHSLKIGLNEINWSPATSQRISFDDFFNTISTTYNSSHYSMFHFPDNLLIPRGLKEGLNLTLFVIITPNDRDKESNCTKSFYKRILNKLDFKPLGFPFHRQAIGFNDVAPNYRFYNITVYHKHQTRDSLYFSPHLY